MTHPLTDLAALSTRQRIRAALGPCAGLDPDEHADRITKDVLQVRIPQIELIEHLNDRVRQFDEQTKADALETGGR